MRRAGIVLAAAAVVAGCGSSGRAHHQHVAAVRPVRTRARGSTRGRAVTLTHGARTHRWIALTFDADMTPLMLKALHSGKVKRWYDPVLLDELRSTRTPATLFLTGLWTQTYPSLARSLARDPLFEIENHSWDHAGWKQPCFGLGMVNADAAKRVEVTKTTAIIQRTTGVTPAYFRYPGGCHSAADDRIVADAGETPVTWDDVSGDAFNPNAAAIAQQTIADAKPGGIVVLHLMGAPNAPATATALRQVIPALKERGFRFVKLKKLLGG
jgi:peptidoglycan/xylan/chitin deacetylase (PgdA/CDA1 family)